MNGPKAAAEIRRLAASALVDVESALAERKPLTWLTQSKDFYRTGDGRFDVVYSREAGAWVAYDFEIPKRREFGTLAAAKAWCDSRSQEGK